MITNEIGYRNTLKHIKGLEQAIEETRQTYPKNGLTKLIVESAQEQLKKLKAEITEYERKHLKKAS